MCGHVLRVAFAILFINMALVCLTCLGSSCPPPPSGLTLEGTLVDAVSPTIPIANTYVYVPHRGISFRQEGAPEDAAVYNQTDENGRFRLEDIPVGGFNGFTVQVAPNEGSGYIRPPQLPFVGIPEGATLVRIRITLLSQAIKDQLDSFRVVPQSATLQAGETRQFTLEATGSGVPATLTPTWLLLGDIGSINEDGVFTATHEVQEPVLGEIVAYLGRDVRSADVQVVPADVASETRADSISTKGLMQSNTRESKSITVIPRHARGAPTATCEGPG